MEAPAKDVDGYDVVWPDRLGASKQAIDHVIGRVRAQSSDKTSMFELLVLEGRSVAEVCAQPGLHRDAVFAWRNGLSKLMSAVAADAGPSPQYV